MLYFSEPHPERKPQQMSDIDQHLLIQISLTCSESFFALRTYALWNNNKIVLVGLLSTAFAMVVTSVGIRFAIIATSYTAIPDVPGCSWSTKGVSYLMLFIFLFVFQLGLVSLTLIRVIQSWRSAKGDLYAIFVKHNLFYYACGFIFSVVNVIMPVLFPNVRKPPVTLQYDRVVDVPHTKSAYYIVLEDLQVCILRILATRMHLHLWHTDQHMHDSDALICTSMFDLSPTDSTV
ncbi:uncharacterized protein EDB93DRAFT_1255036 [Suillus bovinus]|uniref:uncharacterized protein n=1 Tax=Suillus bovinus TaxID=48563 RepID=UPI001B870355|nr:uncharacterized protein EDB93DRAFT_1255036 [Suillus bovinus]KAG2132920.1 hypothetical protein EDB93DRAFT_1255036 [Suillus bovinus]